jgi:HTH-type transcriptional regulator/antitoxin MqsA
MKTCPICSGTVKQKSKEVEYNYKEHQITVVETASSCTRCSESFLSPKELKNNQLKLTNFKRTVDKLLTTNELKRIRKKLELTQKDASEIFGGGIRAFYKYETGENTQSKSLDILLRLIDSCKISLNDVRSV